MHKIHRALGRLSLDNTNQLAHTAFLGARYHFTCIVKLLKADSQKATADYAMPLDSPDKINLYNWHIRSFFWEMVSVWDLILQWVNIRFDLGMKVYKVDHKMLTEHAELNQSEWDPVRNELQAAWDSEWFFEVRMYRNFAHRSFMRSNAIISKSAKAGSPQFFLPFAREGQGPYLDIREQLTGYLTAMEDLGRRILVDD